MSKSKSSNYHIILLEKGYVKGYYEKRNGRLVWVSPYQNSKGKLPEDDSSSVANLESVKAPKLPKFDPNSDQHPTLTVEASGSDHGDLNFVLEVIIRMVKTIDSFEDGERARLQNVLHTAKSIIRELGYLDRGVSVSFEAPKNVKKTRLGLKAERESSAMSKELKKLSRRVTKSTLREKIQTMSLNLEEAL